MARPLSEIQEELDDTLASLAEWSDDDGNPRIGYHMWEYLNEFVAELYAERDEVLHP